MGSDSKTLLLVNEAAAEALRQDFDLHVEPGTWLQVNALEDPVAAGHGLQTAVVCWWIETVTDTIDIEAFLKGRSVRQLSFSGDAGGRWSSRGRPLPFEKGPTLRRWLRRRRVLASPDGYAVLGAFLGASWDESTLLARPPPPISPPPPPPRPREKSEDLRDALLERRWSKVEKFLQEKSLRRVCEGDLTEAARFEDLPALRTLLRGGVEPNDALHATNSAAAVRLLLKHGAKIERLNQEGETPLIAAVRHFNPNTGEGLRALLEGGANPNALFKGKNALWLLKDFVRRHRALAKYAPPVEALLTSAMAAGKNGLPSQRASRRRAARAED